jgi:hypothetical protein
MSVRSAASVLRRQSAGILSVLAFLVPSAHQAQAIEEFVITQMTSTARYAATNSSFRFIVKSGGTTCTRDFPNLPHNEREPGRTDTYTLNVSSCGMSLSSVTASSLYIRTLGHNAWLPSSFKVVARTTSGSTSTLINRTWSNLNWFSTDPYDFGSPNVVKSEWALDAAGSGQTYCQQNLCAPYYRVENWSSSSYDLYDASCSASTCTGWVFRVTVASGYYWNSYALTTNNSYMVRAVAVGCSVNTVNCLKMESGSFVGGPGVTAVFQIY